MKKSTTVNGQYAKFDPIHVSAPQLFVSLNRKDRQRDAEKLHVIYTPDSKTGTATFEFHGPDRLGVEDLRVLQGLIAVASEQYEDAATARVVSKSAGVKEDASPVPESVMVTCSFSYLAKTIGYKAHDSGATIRVIRASIERMSKVTIFFRESKDGRAVRLDSFISYYESDLSADGLRVGLNRRMTAAVLAVNRGEQYLKVHLDEVRSLRSDPARLIHHRLHYLQEGASVLIYLDTLEGYVWLPTESANAKLKRRASILKALEELMSIKWKVHFFEDKSIVRISRAKRTIQL